MSASGLRIAAVEPYLALSHERFLEGLKRHSRHAIEVFALPARAWKWRMRTASLHFAPRVAAAGPWDLLLASDYLDLDAFVAHLPAGLRDVPRVVVFHENQLTYPLQPGERRDHHFVLTHLHSMALCAAVLFNSRFHRESFFAALEEFVRLVPDVDLAPIVAAARARSRVLGLGIEDEPGTPRGPAPGQPPVVLWNHRWEYDKDPEAFVEALDALAREGHDFRVRVLGQRFRKRPAAFERLERRLGERVEAPGFLERGAYREAMAGAHVALSTARHEFFGLATLEALRAGLHPVLPDDLAYPELLPLEERHSGRFLYERREGPVRLLGEALERVRTGGAPEARRALVEHTEGFHWRALAPRYDAVFERAARYPDSLSGIQQS